MSRPTPYRVPQGYTPYGITTSAHLAAASRKAGYTIVVLPAGPTRKVYVILWRDA